MLTPSGSPSSQTLPPVRYRVRAINRHEHVLRIDVLVPTAQLEGRTHVHFRLPTWIPGSYLIREYAKHVIRVSASVANTPCLISKIDKSTWEIAGLDGTASITAHFDIYAFDRSVRGAYLDADRLYFNGAALFPEVIGATGPVELDLESDTPKVIVATTMPSFAVDARGFGRYRVADYDALLDFPVEVSTHARIEFEVAGITHAFAVTSAPRTDLNRIANDAQKICAAHVAMFHGNERPPFSQFLFLLNVLPEGYGGLEHRDSTSLICSPSDLPIADDPTISEGYLRLLGLISHEYFHSWNVKRIKPAAFVPYDLQREALTRQLWIYEGFTSYYDDLALVRCGLLTPDDYLRLLGRNLTALARNAGRNVQSVAASSFDSWIKYYRQDENSGNAGTSYYLKGGLVALLLDLTLRATSRFSLDDVMRSLWQRWQVAPNEYTGTEETEVQSIVETLTGRSWSAWFTAFVEGTEPLPFEAALAEVGVRVRWRAASGASDRGGLRDKTTYFGTNLHALGIALSDDRVKSVAAHSAAANAGIAAGDQLVAVDGIRASTAMLADTLARAKVGEVLRVHLFRDGLLRETGLLVPTAQLDTAWCELTVPPIPEKEERRVRWLNGSAASRAPAPLTNDA